VYQSSGYDISFDFDRLNRDGLVLELSQEVGSLVNGGAVRSAGPRRQDDIIRVSRADSMDRCLEGEEREFLFIIDYLSFMRHRPALRQKVGAAHLGVGRSPRTFR
jgi:hypothetical protein